MVWHLRGQDDPAWGGQSNERLAGFLLCATCEGITVVTVPLEQPAEAIKRRQIYGCGCMARFTMSVARCAGCHAPSGQTIFLGIKKSDET